MSNTLLFGNIPQWGVTTTGSKTGSNSRPSANTSGWNRNQIIITGRDNQTTNRPGVTPPYPTCPYHMPTNLNRFNDLGLNLPIKKKNDIIQLKDINRLIERVVLMTYIWNAEADDILNYRISSKVRGKLPNTLKLLGTTNNNLSGTNLIAKIKKGNTVQQNIPYLRYTLSESILSGANLTKMQTPTSLLDPTDKVKDISVSEDTFIQLPDLRNKEIYDWIDTGQSKLYRVSTYLNASNNLILNYYNDEYFYNKNDTATIAFTVSKINKKIPYLRYTTRDNILSGTALTQVQNPTTLLDPTDLTKDAEIGTSIQLPDLRTVTVNQDWLEINQNKLYNVTVLIDPNYNLKLDYYNNGAFAFSITKINNKLITAKSFYKIRYRNSSNVQKYLYLNFWWHIMAQDITPNSFYKIRHRYIDKDARKPKLQYFYLNFWWHRTIGNTFRTDALTNITESDYTIQETYSTKRGKHPIIVSQPWSNIKTQLNRLIDSLNTLAILVFDGRNDTDTLYRINNFKASNVAMFDGFDPDDPDTNFYNYQAQKGAIIRVGFYNTLVEAYKLMINSCMCNCDCKCNANCLCNTNCGCNYG